VYIKGDEWIFPKMASDFYNRDDRGGLAVADGYRVKLQRVEQPTNHSYHVTIPVVLVEAMGLQKGEELLWSVEDKNTLVLGRVAAVPLRPSRSNAQATPPGTSRPNAGRRIAG